MPNDFAPFNSQKILRVAVLGVGRMGQRHARNVAYMTPRAKLVAVCDPNEAALEWARKNLPADVRPFTNPSEVFALQDLDAVVIATETSMHASLAVMALDAGLHVLLEKPISIDVELAKPVVKAAAQHPQQKIMVGFSRRFDESYREAKRRIEKGSLGNAYLIKSATNDQYDSTGFFVQYSKASGGIFIDCGIHDIDMARWLLDIGGEGSSKRQVKRVFASGINVQHPELEKDGDADNALGTVEFTNGKICTFHLSRTAVHGHDCFAEVFGTKSKLIVNGNPSLNRVEIRDEHGVRTESTPTYYERFKDAFVLEMNEFVACCLEDKPLPVSLDDAMESAKIALALTHSFRNGVPVVFDEEGEAILE